MKRIVIVALLTILFSSHTAYSSSYSDDGLSRDQVKQKIASILFDIPLSKINDPVVGANYYNDWKENPGYLTGCRGYDGGHSGIDMQTKDVAGSKTAKRNFYAVSSGKVITAGGDKFNTIAIYDKDNNRTVIYLHAAKVAVNTDDPIVVGKYLGIQGDKGIPGAEHVHIESRNGSHTTSACGASSTRDIVDDAYSYIKNRGNVSETESPFRCVLGDIICWSPVDSSCVDSQLLIYKGVKYYNDGTWKMMLACNRAYQDAVSEGLSASYWRNVFLGHNDIFSIGMCRQ